jgi:hypothetical protein
LENNLHEKIAFARDILEHNSQLINLADTKAGIFLGINGIILALILGGEKSFSPIVTNSIFLTIIFLGLSSICSILTIHPRLTIELDNTKIYFKSIGKRTKDDYIQSWNTLESSEILRDFLANIHNLAVLQLKKYRYLKFSAIFLFAGFILLISSLVTFLNSGQQPF